MSALEDLIARVEAADGRMSDELLGEVICAVLGKPFGSTDIGCGDDGSDELTVWSDDEKFVWGDYRGLAPDVSLDAALALVERVLPGWGHAYIVLPGEKPRAGLIEPAPDGDPFEASGSTPALALILALLGALQAQGSDTKHTIPLDSG